MVFPLEKWFCFFAVMVVTCSDVMASSIIYVDTQLASCFNYDPLTRSCGSGTNTVYKTVSEAAALATAGTTVLIRGGTYPEQLAPGNSGTAGNYVTFKNYSNEWVYLTGSPAIALSGRSYVIVDGFRVQNTTWLEARNAHYNILRNCVFTHSPAVGTSGNVRFVQSNYNLIIGNDIEDGQDNLLLIDSNYNVVENNIIKEARHSIFGIRCGDFNLVRSNYFSNTLQKIGEIYDCGQDTSAVPHSFNSTHHNVIEQNVFAEASSYYSTSGGNGIQYASQDGIIRRNIFHDCNVGLGVGAYADEGLFNMNNRIYHNVFYGNRGGGIAFRPGIVGNIFKNNTLTSNDGCVPDCFGTSPGQIIYRSPLEGAVFEANALFYLLPGQPVIEEEFGSGSTILQFLSAHPGVLVNTIEMDPQFVAASSYDFHLQNTSPLIDAGAFLTQAVANGSGTNLTVLDAFYFYDGFGIEGEVGDVIQFEGQTETAQVIQVNYTNNILVLSQPLTWNAGQRLALKFNGLAPDVGVFEFDGPLLTWTRNSDTIIFTWPAVNIGFRLKSSPSLSNPVWSDQGEPAVIGDQWVKTNSVGNVASFFKLVK